MASKYKFSSERIEPFIAYMIGVQGMKLIEARDNFINEPENMIRWYELANQMNTYWYTINEVLEKISAVTHGETPHASMAMSNESRKSAMFLFDLGGVHPYADDESAQKFRERRFNFDHLIKKTV